MRHHSITPQAKAEERLDRAFSEMIRWRDLEHPCIACGKPHHQYEAGHYRPRGEMSVRYDYRNVNAEGKECNRTHNTKYGMKDMDLYRLNLNKRWGRGTTDKLYKLSQKMKNWEINHLEQLTSAAKLGFPVYRQLYDSLALTEAKKGS